MRYANIQYSAATRGLINFIYLKSLRHDITYQHFEQVGTCSRYGGRGVSAFVHYFTVLSEDHQRVVGYHQSKIQCASQRNHRYPTPQSPTHQLNRRYPPLPCIRPPPYFHHCPFHPAPSNTTWSPHTPLPTSSPAPCSPQPISLNHPWLTTLNPPTNLPNSPLPLSSTLPPLPSPTNSESTTLSPSSNFPNFLSLSPVFLRL